MTVCNYMSYIFTWLVVQGVSLHKYHLKSVPVTYYTMIAMSLIGRRVSSSTVMLKDHQHLFGSWFIRVLLCSTLIYRVLNFHVLLLCYISQITS